jgi:protein FAM50
MRVKKKCTIGEFLSKAREDLASSYPEYKSIHHNSLIYVKEDFIIPFDYSFYDLLTNKAQGKNGPLIKLTDMVTYEKDEGYVAKILERRWYEKNKHIFPASKWELYDPLKNI